MAVKENGLPSRRDIPFLLVGLVLAAALVWLWAAGILHGVALLVILVVLGVVWAFAYLWIYGRGAWSPAERLTIPLPGDDLLQPGDRVLRLQQEIVIDAPREQVWPILAQLGQRKGGWLAIAWLERLFTFHIYNTFELVDEWNRVRPGDFLFYHQAGIGSQIMEVGDGEYFTSLSDTRHPPTAQGGMAFLPPCGMTHFAWTWNFILEDLPDGRTRFVNRCDATFEPFDKFVPRWVTLLGLGSPSVFMVRRMLEKVKRIAEGRQRPSKVNAVIRAMGTWSDEARPVPLGAPAPRR